jgi:hypothetical protein
VLSATVISSTLALFSAFFIVVAYAYGQFGTWSHRKKLRDLAFFRPITDTLRNLREGSKA